MLEGGTQAGEPDDGWLAECRGDVAEDALHGNGPSRAGRVWMYERPWSRGIGVADSHSGV
ncbi:hypothetical protein D3C80_1988380 [compost metagenome]